MILKITPLAIFIAAALFLAPLAAKAQEKTDAPVQKITQMLYPSVVVDMGRGQGSGTIIYSEWRDDDEAWTMVLTNHHVVKSAIQILSEFDPKKGEEVKREHRRPVKIRFWSYNQFSAAIGTSGRTAHIVAWDRHRDLALLRVEDKEKIYENVAVLWPEDVDGPFVFPKSMGRRVWIRQPAVPNGRIVKQYNSKR